MYSAFGSCSSEGPHSARQTLTAGSSLSRAASKAEREANLRHAEEQLTQLRDSAAIPDQPDRRWVDDWLHRSYPDFWTRNQ